MTTRRNILSQNIILAVIALCFISCKHTAEKKGSTGLNGMAKELETVVTTDKKNAQIIADNALKEGQSHADDTLLLKAYFLYTCIEFENGRFEQAGKYAEQAQEIAKKFHEDELINMLNIKLGNYNLQKSEYSKALNYYLEAENYFEKVDNKKALSNLYNALGIFYFETADYKNSRKYFDKSYDIYMETNNEHGVGVYYANVGNIYMINEDFSNAVKYQEKSLETFKRLKDTVRQLSCMINIANINSNLKKYDTALQELNKAWEIAEKQKDNRLKERILLNFSIVYNEKGDVVKANDYSKKHLELTRIINYPKGRLDGYDQLATAANKTKNYAAYAYNLKKYYALKDSINGSEVKQRIEELKWSNEFEKSKIESDLIKSKYQVERERGNSLLITSILTALAALLIIGLGWVLYRNKKKNLIISNIENEQLTERLEIERLNTEKEKAENDLLKIKSDQQVLELDSKNREITSISLQLVAKNKIMAQISKLIGDKKTSVAAMENELKSILFQNQNQEKDWEQFKDVFEKVHSGFYENLKEKFPQLTATDCRICAFIKIRMSLNEVASIMNISLQSLHTSRYRIRKKLNLDADTNLDDFILNFSL